MAAAPPPSYDQAAGATKSGDAPLSNAPQYGAPQSGYPPPPADDGRWVLSYQDFIPAQTAPDGFMKMGQFEPFSALMVRANEWLRQNPSIKVTVCESVETKREQSLGGPGIVDSNRSCYFESGKHASLYVRGLRIWVIPKGPGENTSVPQQLGYLNVVPACISAGGFLSQPEFEPYSTTLAKLNDMFRNQPLPGKILNVETMDAKFSSWNGSVNPDECYWYESGNRSTWFLNVIRVFYEAGPPCNEQIGSIDFVPAALGGGGGFSLMGAQYEPLSSVLAKANQWMQQNPALPVCNVQSLDYKLTSSWGGGMIDTQRSCYYEAGKFSTAYVRILRVYYVSSTTTSTQQPLRALSYKSFVPAQMSTGSLFSPPMFEPLNQCMTRAMAWLKLTNAKVVGCETQAVKLYMGYGEPPGSSSERTFYYNSGQRAEYFVFAFRIYLDGYYQEPPAELLPPMPQMQQTSGSTDMGCCAIQ